MAQDIRCTLCEDVPAELNCNTCQVDLCDGCVYKHITSKKSSKHEIVPLVTNKSEIQLPECKSHPSMKCEIHCHPCNIAICSKCVIGPHNKHAIAELACTINSMREAMQQETIKLDTVITDEYEKIKTDTKAKLSKIKKEYQSLRRSITDHGKLWHKELDVIIAHFITDIEKMENEDLAILNKQLIEMEKILTEIRNTSTKNKQILTSYDSTQIFNHKSRNDEFRKVPARVELSLPTFEAVRIEGLDLMKQFGTLTSSIKTELSEYNIKMNDSISSVKSVTQLLDVPTEVTTTHTDTIYSMKAVNTSQMWISRVASIDRLDIHGAILETINPLSVPISLGLTVTQEGYVMYTDTAHNTVNMAKKGKIKTVIRTREWSPSSVCFTSTGDLLVCQQLQLIAQNKVVRYSGYKVNQEMHFDEKKDIQFDEKNKPLFAEGMQYLAIAENRDQNICVSDGNGNKVVVLNKAAKVQFRYEGNRVSKKYKTFTPCGIATDSHSQILIADRDNYCIHIITRDGKFLRYIENCHLDKPVDLSVDNGDQLFVSVSHASSVKIIKYMK